LFAVFRPDYLLTALFWSKAPRLPVIIFLSPLVLELYDYFFDKYLGSGGAAAACGAGRKRERREKVFAFPH